MMIVFCDSRAVEHDTYQNVPSQWLVGRSGNNNEAVAASWRTSHETRGSSSEAG
jgi:hypothetical protein